MTIYKKIYKEIKKAKKIVLARHQGPDPDALGSTLGLKEIILKTFPKKEVYVVGCPTSKFSFLGSLDKFDPSMEDGLLIVTDTPDIKRIDIPSIKNFKKIIKIDHHPLVDKYADIEWIDNTSSSASQMIIELTKNTKLKMNKEAGINLFAGLISDTGRFMFKSTTSKTFALTSWLLETVDIDITQIYKQLYLRPYKEIKFQGYLSENFNITSNKVGYIIVKPDILKKYEVDVATPGNMINGFNNIEEILVWTTITYDQSLETYRVSIRSRGPIINEVATLYNGGGHPYASGARIKEEQIQDFISDLDKTTKQYLENE